MYHTTMTRSQLTDLLFARSGPIQVGDQVGRLASVEKEDGSGRSFNVYLNQDGQRVAVHVRITD